MVYSNRGIITVRDRALQEILPDQRTMSRSVELWRQTHGTQYTCQADRAATLRAVEEALEEVFHNDTGDILEEERVIDGRAISDVLPDAITLDVSVALWNNLHKAS
jgi:hypothetical protein